MAFLSYSGPLPAGPAGPSAPRPHRAAATGGVPAGAPAMAHEGLPPDAYEHLSGAAVDRARNQGLALLFGAAFLISLVAVVVLALRPSVQPFILQGGSDGAVQVAASRLVPYQPGDAEKRYFLAQWVTHLLGIDGQLSPRWLAQAYEQTRGQAQVEFTDWVRANSPLQKLKDDPLLVRSVHVSSVSLIGDGVALVRVQCSRRSGANPAAVVEKRLLTVHFQSIPPQTEEGVLRNPIGLQVTHFQVGEDLER